MSTPGRFVWYELLTSDVEAARDFYTKVVGWGLEDWEGGDSPYTMWTAGGTPMGGVMELPGEVAAQGVPPHWLGHVEVEDVDAAAARAQGLGGSIHHPPESIPTVGRFAIIADPQGAALSLFQPEGNGMPDPDRRAPGFMTWHELYTPDIDGALAFYSSLFGWQATETLDMGEMGPYRMFRHPADGNDEPMGGMFDPRQEQVPPCWGFYVVVEDLDAAVARATESGGTIIHGPMEIPGGGRIAQATDPQGGYFALFSAA